MRWAKFAEAFGCAEVAATIVPNSVDVHHIRAAAASALGHYDVAQLAFAIALALDPDDPETLAAAAEFYINVAPHKYGDATRVGLEYAPRRRPRSRRGEAADPDGRSRARLALLEAQGYNDMGQGDDALERVEEALSLVPDLAEAKHERAWRCSICAASKRRWWRFAAFWNGAEDPYAHHHMGLIYERMGRAAASERHFRRARELAPGEFWTPILLSEGEFRSELDRAVGNLPDELKKRLPRVTLEVVDIPDKSDLVAVEPPFSPTILGLFRGLPHGIEEPRAPAGEAVAEPIPDRAIVLYRKNLARAVKTRKELDDQIRRTLIHEIGHLSGLDEDDLRAGADSTDVLDRHPIMSRNEPGSTAGLLTAFGKDPERRYHCWAKPSGLPPGCPAREADRRAGSIGVSPTPFGRRPLYDGRTLVWPTIRASTSWRAGWIPSSRSRRWCEMSCAPCRPASAWTSFSA